MINYLIPNIFVNQIILITALALLAIRATILILSLEIKCCPLAQVMILESWDQVPHQAPHREPASPSAYVSASLGVSLMNK